MFLYCYGRNWNNRYDGLIDPFYELIHLKGILQGIFDKKV